MRTTDARVEHWQGNDQVAINEVRFMEFSYWEEAVADLTNEKRTFNTTSEAKLE